MTDSSYHKIEQAAHCCEGCLALLDDDRVVWVLSRLVQDAVGRHHVVHNIGLGDLLAAGQCG